jgi:prepilin-type N-terminal cleavage/methylation domain-containing protein
LNRNKRGFTLIELCLVVAMVALLSAVAIPKMSRLIISARQAATKGNLGALRSALSIYYADNLGTYPRDDLRSLTRNGKYLTTIPGVTIPSIIGTNPGHVRSNLVCNINTGCVIDMGGFGYQNISPSYTDPDWGTYDWGILLINCIHPDSKGELWYLQ